MAEQQRYEFKKVPEEYLYDFFSEGPNGKVKKVARYRLIDEQNSIYNLGFGDWDEKNDDINDRVKTNNLDREKVLMTIADTIVDFTANHPKAAIFIQGSTLSRTRLYQNGYRRILAKHSRNF